MDLDGKTLVRIYKQKDGVVAFNTFMDGEDIGFEIIGALEIVKRNLIRDMNDTEEEISEEDSKKVRRLLDGN